MVRKAPIRFREVFAEDQLPVAGWGVPAPGEEGGVAAIAVGVRCVHQGALGARGTEAVAPFGCPPGGTCQSDGCAGKGWRPQGPRLSCLAAQNDIAEEISKRLPKPGSSRRP